MKKVVLVFAVLLLSGHAHAQTDILTSLKKLIYERYPDIDLNEKLIAYNIWSVDDAESRELNKSFEKTVEVFGLAKLKGGRKGILVVAINRDKLNTDATIAFDKDGNANIISVREDEIVGLRRSSPVNAIYDSLG